MSKSKLITSGYIKSIVGASLFEDQAQKDITTDLLVNKNSITSAKIIANEDGIIGGLDFADESFKQIDKDNNGSISAAELSAYKAQNNSFASIDTDKDKKISFDDLGLVPRFFLGEALKELKQWSLANEYEEQSFRNLKYLINANEALRQKQIGRAHV